MTSCKDTKNHQSFDETISIIENSPLEFERVFESTREATCEWQSGKPTVQETEIIYWSRKNGMILFSESYSPSGEAKSTNMINVLFEIEMPENKDREALWESLNGFSHRPASHDGKWYREVELDCRDAMHFKLAPIINKFKLCPIWHNKNRFVWLLNYSDDDTEGYDYKAITKQKILSSKNEDFKEWVRKCGFLKGDH